MTGKETTNADLYLVGTKTITQLKPMPVLISAGVRGTNAELWGLGGNAPNLVRTHSAMSPLSFRVRSTALSFLPWRLRRSRVIPTSCRTQLFAPRWSMRCAYYLARS